MQKAAEDHADRATERWDESDYRRLAAGLREGLDDLALAEAVGRTPRALHSRARMLLRAIGYEAGTLDDLRGLVVEDPAFDLVMLATDAHDISGVRLWTADDDETLKAAFAAGEPHLPVLADQLGASELQVVDRLMRLRIARSTIEIDDRLHADPIGAVALRAVIARDKKAAMLWVLSVVDRAREHIHVSLHPTATAAEDALAALQPASSDVCDHRERWFWTIAQRVVGEGSIRAVTTGAFHPRAAP